MIALTRLDVAPAIVLLDSVGPPPVLFGSLMDLRVPPGVETWISLLRGVEGAKNGEASTRGAIVVSLYYI